MTETTERSTAEKQASEDAAIMDMLVAKRQEPPTPRKSTLGENFIDAANLIASARVKTRLNEATLIKLWELTLMWQLNNRQSATPDIYPPEADDLPTPDEIITAITEEN